MVQEIQKKQKRKIEFQNLQENRLTREMKLLLFLKKEFFHIKIIHLKQKKKKNQKKKKKKNQTKTNFFKYIENESEDINYDLFKDYFNFVVPTVFAKQLFQRKNKNKNSELVNVIKSGIIDLKDKIKMMSKDEKKIEKSYKILKIVEKIFNFNDKIQKKSGGGLKILTPDQMLSRLPITLAQIKAGNNSKKLKNEIRQLLYSL